MNKYLGIIFWSMLVVAGVLGYIATDQLENRLDNMESKIEDINTILKEMNE